MLQHQESSTSCWSDGSCKYVNVLQPLCMHRLPAQGNYMHKATGSKLVIEKEHVSCWDANIKQYTAITQPDATACPMISEEQPSTHSRYLMRVLQRTPVVRVGKPTCGMGNALGQVLVEEGLGIGSVLGSIGAVELGQQHMQAWHLHTILVRVPIALHHKSAGIRD